MFGRKIGLFAFCVALFPAVTVCDCKYIVKLKTGYAHYSGTDDFIKMQIRENGPWHRMDNYGHDDLERGKTDTFKFEDRCQDKHQQVSIRSWGHATFFKCFSNEWLLIYVTLMPENGQWKNEWQTYTWFSCGFQLRLPRR